ncbi:hypothetical protein D9M71_131840 [compost metagenome]
MRKFGRAGIEGIEHPPEHFQALCLHVALNLGDGGFLTQGSKECIAFGLANRLRPQHRGPKLEVIVPHALKKGACQENSRCQFLDVGFK